MGYKHDRTDILDAAVDHVARHGFDQLSFGKLAAHMGIADRTIVYYFPWKAKLLEAVAARIVSVVLGAVAEALGDRSIGSVDPVALASAIDDPQGLLGPYAEVLGKSAAGVQPYLGVVQDGRAGWMLDGALQLAMLDGLLVNRQISAFPSPPSRT